jgi:hypothetical protein
MLVVTVMVCLTNPINMRLTINVTSPPLLVPLLLDVVAIIK